MSAKFLLTEKRKLHRWILTGILSKDVCSAEQSQMYRDSSQSANGNAMFQEPVSCAATVAWNFMALIISKLQQNLKSAKYRKTLKGDAYV